MGAAELVEMGGDELVFDIVFLGELVEGGVGATGGGGEVAHGGDEVGYFAVLAGGDVDGDVVEGGVAV